MPPVFDVVTPPRWQDRFYSRGLNRSSGGVWQQNGKAYVGGPGVVPTIDVAKMTATATITTPTPDRSEDVVHPQGVLIENYRRNPVVFYDHGMSHILLPIGKSEDTEGNLTLVISEAGIDATTHFAQSLCEACQVFALIEEGIIKSTSIGFMPLEATPRGQNGLDITVWELLEYSWVGIPDNPEAVRKVLDRGKLAGSAFCEPIKTLLTKHAAPVPKFGRGFTKMADENDKPEDQKPADDNPVEKQDEVADEPVDGEPGETEKPLGMQLMAATFNALSSAHAQITAGMGPCENPSVKEALGALCESLGGSIEELKTAYTAAYPDSDELKPEESDEDKSAVKFLANHLVKRNRLSGLAFELGTIKKLTPAQKAVVDSVAKRIRSIATEAKAAAPKPEDPHAKELAEVRSSVKALVKRFEEILPAKA